MCPSRCGKKTVPSVVWKLTVFGSSGDDSQREASEPKAWMRASSPVVQPSGSGLAAVTPTSPDQMSVFWWDGQAWVQMFGQLDAANQVMMASGDFTSVDVVTTLFGTTTNTAQASGTLSDGSVCAPTSAFDTVTVEAFVPACSIAAELYKVEDDKLKIDLTNNDTRDRTVTMETVTVSYPAARGLVEKVKLDGDVYKYDDSDNPILDNPATFGPDDWTQSDVSKRQISVGGTERLEIETFDKGDKSDRFELTVEFGDWCVQTIIVENEAIVE